jgi:3-oxoacyl-(acyl-carrier-protein) synthase/NAD(P)-dependent dehydrogenase (short-subunit alcohol dehydrogenase family)/acyl carrier protein
MMNKYYPDSIAIIGMACKFPNAETVLNYWDIIENGKSCVKKFPENRKKDYLDHLKLKNSRLQDEHSYRDFEKIEFYAGGYLDDISCFDYSFFNISPEQAKLMDPHQRLLLETGYHAFEDAGYNREELSGSNTGVYLGHEPNIISSYANMIYNYDPDLFQIAFVGNLPALLPSRISFFLNLKGPSISYNTACSSSLVALDSACKGLMNGDCEMALVGGVKVYYGPEKTMENRIGFESSDGRTRAFDADSDGTGFGEGAGVILLKPLEKAIEDNDNIHALILGSALNQDGKTSNITAPNMISQYKLLCKIWECTKIDPSSISYIESHGTGTQIGDPIEIEAIQKAFREKAVGNDICAIGAVKNNIGHLLDTSGMASLIKSILCLKKSKLPPIINFNKINPNINLNDSPVYINTVLKDWTTTPKRCGVSAFGLSGTNAHVILEEKPDIERNPDKTCDIKIFTISANSTNALENFVKSYFNFLNDNPDINEEDLCYTANTGKTHFKFRIAILLDKKDKLKDKLIYLMNDIDKELVNHNIFNNFAFIKKNAKVNNDYQDGQMELILKSDTCELEKLKKITTLYLENKNIPWKLLYKDRNLKRISLPLYPFERKRCWIDYKLKFHKKTVSDENLFYRTTWKKEKLSVDDVVEQRNNIIVIHNNDEISMNLIRKIEEAGHNVINICHGGKFIKFDNRTYEIKNDDGEYYKVFEDMKSIKIDRIISMSTIGNSIHTDDFDRLSDMLNLGIFDLLRLIKELISINKNLKVKITVVSENINIVTGREEIINPINSILFGFCKILAKEYVNYEIKLIDMDKKTSCDELFDEMFYGGNKSQIALRESERFAEYFTSVDINSLNPQNIAIRSDNVYLITGGTGGIGLEVTKSLASQNKIKIILISRSKFPERSEWEAIIKKGDNIREINKIKLIMDVEKNGSQIFFYHFDISDYEQAKNKYAEIRNKFGRINGIVHCAGIRGENIISRSSKESFMKVFASKVNGLCILHDIFKKDKIDFYLLCSSIASIFGFIGQAEYAAANSFLDSFAYYLNNTGIKALTINWVAWKEVGMAFDTGYNIDTSFKAIKNKQAMDAMLMALNKQINRIVIGELNYSGGKIHLLKNGGINLSEALLENIKYAEKNDDIMLIGKQQQEHARDSTIIMTGKEDGAYSETESSIGQIWGETLGYDKIDINENFFDLGGDSITALMIINKINQRININVELSEIINYLTISDMSKFIDNKKAELLKKVRDRE